MKLKQLFADEDAVSPVIGVILMVAITVILAAVIGAFVLGIGGSQEQAPQVQWEWSDDSSNGAVTLEHGGGDTVTSPGQITASGDIANDYTLGGDSWTAGDTVEFSDETGASGPDVSNPSSTGTITLTWTASSGDSSQILSEHEYDLS